MRAANNMSGTVVGAGADLYSIIDAGAVGETFVLTASPAQPYRITMPLSFKSGQTLFSKSGSVIKGSRIVNGWTQESGTGYWYKDIALSDYSNPSVQSNMTGYAYKISGEVDQAQKLHQMVLHHVAHRTRGIVIGASPFHADGFGHGDLHVVDVFGLPQRLEQYVGKAHGHQVLDRLLAQVCLLYTSPSPRDGLLSRMPSSA